MPKEYRNLEILVAKLQHQLAPNAEVIHDAKLKGRLSQRERQIDVLVRQRIGQYEMVIVLDCKDYARPVDVKGVEEFHGLIADVGANKGALVCPMGFTQAAKTRAEGLQIDLYSPIDTEAHKWKVRVTAPMICDFRRAMMAFGISSHAPAPLRLPYDFFKTVVAHDKEGRKLGIPLAIAMNRWNAGEFPVEEGEHREVPIYSTREVLIDNGYGSLTPLQLTVSLLVEKQLFFGDVVVSKLSGFKDELAGGIITNAFTLGILEPEEVMSQWTQIATENDAPRKPMVSMRGLIGWCPQNGVDS